MIESIRETLTQNINTSNIIAVAVGIILTTYKAFIIDPIKSICKYIWEKATRPNTITVMEQDEKKVYKEVYADLMALAEEVVFFKNFYESLNNHPELFEHYMLPKDGDPEKWDRYNSYAMTEKKEQIRANEFLSKVVNTRKKYNKVRVIFDPDLSNKITHFFDVVGAVSIFTGSAISRDPYDFKPMVCEDVITHWEKHVPKSIVLFEEIEACFRSRLGIGT